MANKLFCKNCQIDVDALRATFCKTGRLKIEKFVSEGSILKLADELSVDSRWVYVINGGTTVFEITRTDYEALEPTERARIDAAVLASAARGFQFRYETIRVADDPLIRSRSDTLLDEFADFMSMPETLSLFTAVTGVKDILFADAQATRYAPGDFLTQHDDNVAGKHRRLAYVLGLTPEWRADWGGLLTFTSVRGDVVETFVPRFGTLSLFSVPQPHSVSYVSPYAPHARVSVTGWLRSQLP